MPWGPWGPVAPVAPVGPVGPAGPAGPVSPLGPCRPRAAGSASFSPGPHATLAKRIPEGLMHRTSASAYEALPTTSSVTNEGSRNFQITHASIVSRFVSRELHKRVLGGRRGDQPLLSSASGQPDCAHSLRAGK